MTNWRDDSPILNPKPLQTHLLGIRHHGVGSARNVREALERLQPDLVLVEGPPELTELIHWVAHRDLRPPVALLAYDADDPKRAAFYPFAEYSPEWVALKFALSRDIPARMLDLSLRHSLVKEIPETPGQTTESDSPAPEAENPLDTLARLGGYDDQHGWWEAQIEQNPLLGHSEAHFEAVALLMKTTREAVSHSAIPDRKSELLREAAMRQGLRQAEKEGFQCVVYVCGAWHMSALAELVSTKKEDDTLLKGLPTVRVRCSWIPWTNERLGWWSGYGAGIPSPGWYEHRWHRPDDPGVEWLTKVARLFRRHQTDVSTAHVIEAFRLAECLAALRGLPRPGLGELNEATQAVMCMGDGILMNLVETELTVAYRLGTVPDELPKLPLQADFEATVKTLRLELREDRKPLELDLRKDLDRSRSVFFHRLAVLDLPWAEPQATSGKGTFKEGWSLKWQPEGFLKLIEKAVWGNRVEDAATQFLLDRTRHTNTPGDLARLLESALPAELFGAVEPLLAKLDAVAATSADVPELMSAAGPLLRLSRYGDVRQTDLRAVRRVVEGLLTRVCVGLPTACVGLADEAAQHLMTLARAVDEGLRLLENASLAEAWRDALRRVADGPATPPLLTGGTVRLLFDGRVLDETDTARRFALALSTGQDPTRSAAWLEGFLRGSGTILLYDERLWGLLHGWVAALDTGVFTALLPVLRRTFSKFDSAERRQLGEKAREREHGGRQGSASGAEAELDAELAEWPLPLVGVMLGI